MKLFKYIALAFSSLFMCGCADYLDNAPDDTLHNAVNAHQAADTL